MKSLRPILIASIITALAPTVVASPDPNLVWVHSETGLMWSKCPVGSKLNGEGCDAIDNETKRHFNWHEAMIAADELDFAGYQDWRVPTVEELASLPSSCEYIPQSREAMYVELWAINGEAGKNGIPKGCYHKLDLQIKAGTVHMRDIWTSSLPADYPTQEALKAATGISSMNSANVIRGDHRGGWESEKHISREMLVVRGGNPRFTSEARANQARTEIAETKAQNTKMAQDAAAAAEKEAAKYRKAVADSRKNVANYKAKTELLRKNVKPGDKLTNGMVLAVKGDLVQIQVMKKECVDYSASINSFSHKRDCLRYTVVPNGTAWVNRNEILPAE